MKIGKGLALCAAVASGCLVVCSMSAKSEAQGVTIAVDPSGRDEVGAGAARSGALLGPVRTLAYAVTLAREVRAGRGNAGGIAIELSPGVHRIDAAVKLGREDSGSPGQPLVIRGSSDGKTVLSGSVVIAPEAGVVRGYARLGPAAVAKARIYRLPARLAGVQRIDTALPRGVYILNERFKPNSVPSVPFEVFDGDGAMRPARWPNSGWGSVVAPAGDGWWSFKTDAPRADAWRGEPDLWAAGYWKHDYTYERHHVGEVKQRAVNVSTPFVFGLQKGARYHVYHALAELDAPGEWYRDHAKNVLIAWPRENSGSGAAIEVSVVESAIVSEGASHVRIRNLTIEKFFGDAVRVVGGRDIAVERSTLRWAGLRGASFVEARDSGIANSDISDTGEGGVLLSGGERQTLSPARLYVRDCRIERFARIGYTFKPAVDMHGVGNVVAGNYIADAPNFGIHFQGNDHVIEDNEITDVVNDSADAGAIYTSHDWTARGSIVRRNFLHDILPGSAEFEVKGVYLDDFTSGISVSGNVFLRVQQPVFIGGGRDNLVEGNLFIDADPAVHVDSRGLDWSSKFVTDPTSDLRKRLAEMPVASAPWRSRYKGLADLLEDEPGVAKRNVSRGNAILGGRAYYLETKAETQKQTLGPDRADGVGGRTWRLELVEALKRAKSAAEIGRLLGREPWRELGGRDGLAIDFAKMDRSSRAGRSPTPSLGAR